MRSSAMLLSVSLMLAHRYAQARPHPPTDGEAGCQTANMASTYVPIESWTYPAIERLAMAGYVQTAFAGLRPWTRMESARLVAEALEQQIDHQNDLDSGEVVNEQMNSLIKNLAGEFAAELRQRDGECNRQAAIDSIDSRSTAIAGAPLTDGYHFAQTLTNDYGRPYGRGAQHLHRHIQSRGPGLLCVLLTGGLAANRAGGSNSRLQRMAPSQQPTLLRLPLRARSLVSPADA